MLHIQIGNNSGNEKLKKKVGDLYTDSEGGHFKKYAAMKFIPGMVAAGLAQNNRNKLKDKELESEGKEKQSKFKKGIKIAGSVIGNAAANAVVGSIGLCGSDHLDNKSMEIATAIAQAAPTAISAINALRLKNKLNKLEKKEKEEKSQK